MSSLDQLQWQSVEVDDDVITDEAGFLGLEVLDGSQVIVEKQGDGWSVKAKTDEGKDRKDDQGTHSKTNADVTRNPNTSTKITNDSNKTTKKRKKKRKRKNKKKPKLQDAIEVNSLNDNECALSTSIVPASGYVDQHVIYYNQQNDWSRLGLNLNICNALLKKQFKIPL